MAKPKKNLTSKLASKVATVASGASGLSTRRLTTIRQA